MGNYKYHYLLLVFSINASSGWLVGQLLSFFRHIAGVLSIMVVEM